MSSHSALIACTAVSILFYNGACKNEPMPKRVNSEQPHTKEAYWMPPSAEKAKETTTPLLTQPIQPRFNLKNMKIQAGTSYNAKLGCQQLTEGYCIQSVRIIKDSTLSYVPHFSLHTLRNQPIPIHGLSFTVTPSQKVKPGDYLLLLTIGKYGKGSKATLQFVQCTITVCPNDEEIDSETTTCHPPTKVTPSTQQCARQTTLSEEAIPPNLNSRPTSIHEKENSQTPIENTSPPVEKSTAQPSFILDDSSVQAGSSCLITVKESHPTNEYRVKTISVQKDNATGTKGKYYTKQFITEEIKKQPIPASGLTFPLTVQQQVKPGIYRLKLIISKPNKPACQQAVYATVTVVP
ncbi:MAG: hypothetical protein NQ127_02185 [Candidatus Cardinium sp.]|nr:hypothetical protein [Candidatus Cardinium sp.]